MTKNAFLAVGLLFLGAALVASAVHATEPGEALWFDMENCAFCKNLSKDPQLMKNMSWEHHDISNGVATITVVKPEFKKSYLEAQAAMMDVGKKMQSGELKMADVKMCGHCQNYGKLMMMGAKMEHVQGTFADVTLMTSDNPEMVKEIKAFAQRNRDEMAKMEQAEKAEKPAKTK